MQLITSINEQNLFDKSNGVISHSDSLMKCAVVFVWFINIGLWLSWKNSAYKSIDSDLCNIFHNFSGWLVSVSSILERVSYGHHTIIHWYQTEYTDCVWQWDTWINSFDFLLCNFYNFFFNHFQNTGYRIHRNQVLRFIHIYSFTCIHVLWLLLWTTQVIVCAYLVRSRLILIKCEITNIHNEIESQDNRDDVQSKSKPLDVSPAYEHLLHKKKKNKFTSTFMTSPN